MKLKPSKWIIRTCRCRERAAFFAAALLGALAVVPPAQAQSVLTPPPEYSVTPPALQEFQTNRAGVNQPPPMIAPGPLETPLQWGEVSVRPHVFYRVLYGDGILSSPGNQVTTAINEISPGVFIGIGGHFTLDYTPTWRFYSSDKLQDSLDHNVRFTGGTTYEDWVLGLSQTYTLSSVPEVETGSQVTEESFLTDLTASYRINSKMSMDLGVNQHFTSPGSLLTNEVLTGYRQWSTLDWLNYEFWRRLAASIGAGFGYLDVDTGPDELYEQVQARVTWQAGDKTSLQVHGGVEDRQFLSGGVGDLISPVFGAAILYRPFETTTLSVSADRTVSASYFPGQATETTGFSAALTQRLLEKLWLNLGGGYSSTHYVASEQGLSAGRSDDYYFFNTRLSWRMLKRASVAVTYQYNEDISSSGAAFSFSGNQVGLELGYRY